MSTSRGDVRSRITAGVLFAALAALAPALVEAQPFGNWMILQGDGSNPPDHHGYSESASNPALNPTSAITIEGWVSLGNNSGGANCRSLIGKNWQTSFWVGLCGSTLRSYLTGSGSLLDGGSFPTSGEWTHFAVTYDGAMRRHYIHGELVQSHGETGSLPTSASALRIGSDVSYDFSPTGTLNEFRLWNVARTQDEIRSTINVPLTAPQPGLVAVWSDGQHDALGSFTGTLHGTVFFLNAPVTISCGSSNATFLCLFGHFSVGTVFRQGPPGSAETRAQVGPSNNGSGIFWFFSPDNWEVTVKMVNGCGLNSHNWTFITSDTSLFFRTEVTDVKAGVTKVYFNYPTLTPFSILDTSSMPCP
jgi:hypothetical protein